MYYSYVKVEYVATSFSPARTDLALKLLTLLDSYRCHIMALVANVIQDQGCKVVNIPGGCTSLVQPLHLGYNKPFKIRVCACWDEYMINNMRTNGSILMPLHLDVSAWVAEAYWDLEKSPIVKNL
jgi:hypothetical protein